MLKQRGLPFDRNGDGVEDIADHLRGGATAQPSVRREEHAVAKHGSRELFHIVRGYEVSTVDGGVGLRYYFSLGKTARSTKPKRKGKRRRR